MKTRKLGWTDLELSVIGLGTWAMGDQDWMFGWGPQDESDSVGAIHKALDRGVNWLDTAAVYGHGRSEQIVGKAIKGMSEKPLLATKCGRIEAPDDKIEPCIKPDSMRRELEDSLRFLGVETVDLYQIHWPEPDEDIEEAWEAIAQFVQEGKVRYGGVSNYKIEHMKRLESMHPVASLQPPYSMIRRDVEEALLGYCAERDIGVVAYSPMQKGILTDKFSREWVETMAENDHRRKDPMFSDPQLGANVRLVEGLKAVAGRNGRTVAELSVAWVLRRPEVTSAIVGARRPSQAEANARAGDWTLAEEDIAAVEELLSERMKDVRKDEG